MKKNIPYRDQLIELSKLYKIQEIKLSNDAKEILNIFQNEIQVPKWVASEESSESFNNFLKVFYNYLLFGKKFSINFWHYHFCHKNIVQP